MVDIFAHAAVSYLAVGRRARAVKDMWLSVALGVIPDLCSRAAYLVYSIFIFGAGFRSEYMANFPKSFYFLYGLTHSLLVFFIVLAGVYLLMKKVPIYLWAWGLHIVIDIFTHKRDFLPVPFLWPISKWYFPGISWWGSPWYIAFYWTLIVAAFVYVGIKGKRRKKKRK